MTMTTIEPSPATLPLSLQTIVDFAEANGVESPSAAAELLHSARVTQEDLMPWADFEHPVTDSYGRKAVALGANYELMIMSWSPGDFSAIHDHGSTEWGAVMYFGDAEHATYELINQRLVTTDRRMMSAGQLNEVDHHLIHQMGNPTSRPFLSLHLYGCHKPTDGVTNGAKIFDLLEDETQFTDGGVFYCLPDQLINRRSTGVMASPETIVEHHLQMLDRIERIMSKGKATKLLMQKAKRLRQQLASAAR